MICTVMPAIQMEALGSGLYSIFTLLFSSKVVFGGKESISSRSPESKTIIIAHPSSPVKSLIIPFASMAILSFVHPVTKRIAENKMKQILFISSFQPDNELKANVAYLFSDGHHRVQSCSHHSRNDTRQNTYKKTNTDCPDKICSRNINREIKCAG